MPERSTLQSQVLTRLDVLAEGELVKVMADYAMELGVPIPLTTRSYGVLLDFAKVFNPAEVDAFDMLKTKIERGRELAAIYMNIQSDSDAGEVDPMKVMEGLLEISGFDDLSAIIFAQLVSPDAELKRAFEAMLTGDAGELESLAYKKGDADITIFRAGSPELDQLEALSEAINYHNQHPLARMLNPGLRRSVTRFGQYYITLPDTPERAAVDALARALEDVNLDGLKDLLKEMGYSIHRVPVKKPKKAVASENSPA